MNARELVDHIHSGPTELVLDEPLHRFRRRTRSNPCDFNDFLQALRSSETIRSVTCCSQLQLYITEHEWVLLVKTIGSIKCIDYLSLSCEEGSRSFRLFQAVADAVNNAHSLCMLEIHIEGETLPKDPPGLTALVNALREHTGLQEFYWCDCCSHVQLDAMQMITTLDPVLRVLPACPRLRKVVIMTKCVSAAAMQNLLQLRPATDLRLILETEQWLAVANEIRHGRCNVQRLTLAMLKGESSMATEAVKAVASAIKLDHNLKYLKLQMENGFADEVGVALAEALTVNKTLSRISLAFDCFPYWAHRATLGAPAYEAFSAMLGVNTSLILELPPFGNTVDDERLVDSHNQMCLEQRLNHVGRGGLLSSSQTTREQWVDALHKLSTYDDDDVNDSPLFFVSCVYSLLRLQPAIYMWRVDDTFDSGGE
jgi:hypothetical protein